MKEPCMCGALDCPFCGRLQGTYTPDEPLDGDMESGLASAGFGTDEDYEHYDEWFDE